MVLQGTSGRRASLVSTRDSSIRRLNLARLDTVGRLELDASFDAVCETFVILTSQNPFTIIGLSSPSLRRVRTGRSGPQLIQHRVYSHWDDVFEWLEAITVRPAIHAGANGLGCRSGLCPRTERGRSQEAAEQ